MATAIVHPIAQTADSPISQRPLAYYVNGAVISEALDSDAGNFIALDRKEVVKRWIVRCPFIDDQPTKYLSILFPQGQDYGGLNDAYLGLVVYGWDEGERIGIQEWHSAVVYRSADELATLNWVSEGEFSEEQEHVARDVDGKLIGHSVYRILDAPETRDAEAAGATGKTLWLKRTGAFKITGLDRYRGIHRFNMMRVLPVLKWYQIRRVGTFLWWVNNDRFLSYQPGELAFTNFGWREVFGAIPNTPQTAKQYEVRLHFAHNPDFWSPVTLYETFTDEEGFESPVYEVDAGGPLDDPNFVIRYPYRFTPFVNLFRLLNTDLPA